MIMNNFFTVLSMFGLAVFYFKASLTNSLTNSSLSHADGRPSTEHGNYVIFKQKKYPHEHQMFTHLLPRQSSPMYALTTSSRLLSTKSLSDGISATQSTSLPPSYIYKAAVPTSTPPGLNKIQNALNISNGTSHTRNTTNVSLTSLETVEDLSKNIIGSSTVAPVSVILNGSKPEFTDALGQKVPKPQLSLQVASPIDLLNPDRYEFYTFDEDDELVKRLMTMEEIQSIAANGDGEGPSIIHHGQIEDHDPEKNVQDIVDSVQSVLNKEVESNKNTAMESLLVLGTPDVASTWSIILPIIFGNSGVVDVFSHQKHQQIVMTPESEIIDTSTKKVIPTTVKISKPSKRKPGQKRKSTSTTTDITPQVIQEELDSRESVYTGMQQYENLAASLQNYDGFSQLQPIYYKLPEIEASTSRVIVNDQYVIKKPIIHDDSKEAFLAENHSTSLQNKSIPLHRVENPNKNHTCTKLPHLIKQKLESSTTVSTISVIPTTIAAPSATFLSITPAVSTAGTETVITSKPSKITTAESSVTFSSLTMSVATLSSNFVAASTTKPPKTKNKKPTHNQVNSTITIAIEKRRPSTHSYKRRPSPNHQHTKHQQVSPLTEGTTHQEMLNNMLQSISYDKIEPKPINSFYTTTMIPSNTILFSTSLLDTTKNPVEASLVRKDIPGNRKKIDKNENYPLPTKSSPIDSDPTTFNIVASSFTSGYPVPSNDLLIDKLENVDTHQDKGQPIVPQDLTKNENKTYPQDAHTLKSFSQIMHTLKNHAQLSEKLVVKSDQHNENVSLKPLDIGSYPIKDITNQGKIKDFETTSSLPSGEKTYFNYETNNPSQEVVMRPLHYFFTDVPEDIATKNPIEKSRYSNTDAANFYDSTPMSNIIAEPFVFTTFTEEETKRTSQHQDHTQKSEAYTYSTPPAFTGLPTITNDNQASKDQLEIETYSADSLALKQELGTKHSQNPSNPILASNLKPQMYMETIKTLGQISMSDFQTHAATVASTLIDGTRTLLPDHSESKSALRQPDSILDVSNKSSDSNIQATNFNANRFSSPPMDESTLTATYFTHVDGCGKQPNCKHFQNQELKHFTLADQNASSNSSVENARVPDLTTLKEIQSPDLCNESDKKLNQKRTSLNDININQTEHAEDLNEEYNGNNSNDSTSTVYIREINTTTKINTMREKSSTILPTFASYYQQQKLEDDVEVDSSKDNTTLFSRFFEDTTLSPEQSSTTERERGTLNGEIVVFSESITTNGLIAPAGISVNTDSVNAIESMGTLNETAKTSKLTAETFHIPDNHITENSSQSLQPKHSKEETTMKINESEEYTTSIPLHNKEASVQLPAMISNQEETSQALEGDPYIKLGETTTIFSSASAQNMLIGPKPVQTLPETGTQSSVVSKNITTHNELYEESDKEDEEDQFGAYVSKRPSSIKSKINQSMNDAIRETTTTTKPATITLHRLSTLKPISYFNKQIPHVLHQETKELLYSKHGLQTSSAHLKRNKPLKVTTYSMKSQGPTQRPPQLNNVKIVSLQSTTTPVKLESSLFNSKGLEVSLANLDKDILAFAKLCNQLAFNYWQSMTTENISSSRSLVISPFALTSMLAMIFLGARGSTSGEMNDLLKLDDMVTFNPHLVFKNITESVEKCIDSEIATTAFVRETYSDRANGKVLQFFKEKTQQFYNGHVEEINFYVVNDIIHRRTNLLMKRHTMGKVLEYLRTNNFWVNGPLAAVSANLFQTDCSKGSTQDRDGEIFFEVHSMVRQRRVVPIPSVLFKSGFTAGYEPNLGATIVAFGRPQDTTSVIYIKPGDLNSGLPSGSLYLLEKQLIEKAISGNVWSSLLTSLMVRPGMEVQVPRFSHRSFVNATTLLKQMGLKRLFKSGSADLGGLTGSPNHDIYLSDMIQINTFSTCGEEKIADHHHVELYPMPPLRKRNKDVNFHGNHQPDSSENATDFGATVQDPITGRGFYDDLLNPKYLELPLPLRPRQARLPESPRIRFDRPFLYFVRHNPTGMILFIGRFNPRLLL